MTGSELRAAGCGLWAYLCVVHQRPPTGQVPASTRDVLCGSLPRQPICSEVNILGIRCVNTV